MNIVKSKGRDLNFELLRITSMMAIVFGHLSSTGPALINPLALFGDVNCFILITGYFMANGKFKASRIVRLVIETIFYCFLITLIFYIINPHQIGVFQLLKSIFPFAPTSFSYWFVNKYLGLILLQPFLSYLIKNLTKKQFKYLIILLLILNSQLVFFFPFSALFDNGWSLPWFITIFLIGAYLRIYQPFKKSNGIILWVFIWFISLVLINLIYYWRLGSLIEISYNNWIFFIKSFATFMMFKEIKIPSNSMLGKCIAFIAPNVFAIYIIHCQHYMSHWLPIIGIKFTYNDNLWIFFLLYCVFVLVIMTSCVLIDKTRLSLFNIIGITNSLNLFSKRIDRNLKSYLPINAS